MSSNAVDYDALAKQYGATSSQPQPAPQQAPQAAQQGPDYDALAKQYGATSSEPQSGDPYTNPDSKPTPDSSWMYGEDGTGAIKGRWISAADRKQASNLGWSDTAPSDRTAGDYARQIGTNAVAGVGDVVGGLRDTILHPINTGKALLNQTGDFIKASIEDERHPEASWQGRTLHAAETLPLVGGLVRQVEAGSQPTMTADGGYRANYASPQSIGAATRAIAQLGAAKVVAKAPEAINNAVAGAYNTGVRLKAPLGDTVDTPRGAVRPEGYTPRELMQYAQDNGIPINAAQATEHNFPRNVQGVGERATVGGTAVKKQIQAAQAAVGDHVNKLLNDVDPASPQNADVMTTGDGIQQSVQKALDAQQDLSRQNYTAVDKAANGVTVNAKSFKDAAATIQAETSFIRKSIPSLDTKRVSGILSDITAQKDAPAPVGPNGTPLPTQPTWTDFVKQNMSAQMQATGSHGAAMKAIGDMWGKRAPAAAASKVDVLPDNLTFSQAQAIRSRLLDESLHPDIAISNVAQGRIKKLIGILDSSMMDAAQSDPTLASVFRDSNEHWKGLQEDFNGQRSPLSQILSQPDPSKVPQILTQKGQSGGSPYRVDLLDKYDIDKGPVKRMIVQDMFNRDFGLFKNKSVAGYSDEFLKSVFTPEELDNVYKTGAIARSVAKNANPSGTAAIEGAMADVTKPVRSMLPKGLAAKATMDPRFNKWLMNPKNPPSYSAYLHSRKINGTTGAVAAVGSANAQDQE